MSLREAALKAVHALDKQRMWNGQGWTYNPLPARDYLPALEALRAALAEAEAPKAEPMTGTCLDQIAEAKRDMAQWPQWMQDAAHVSAAVAHPPAPGAELSDEEILSVWRQTVEALPDRIVASELRVSFARAVLAARGKG